MSWSPHSGYALVHTAGGGYLWHIPSDSKTQLNAAGQYASEQAAWWSWNGRDTIEPVRSFMRHRWDMQRGQLIGVPVERRDVVIAYDLTSGQPVAEYGIDGRASSVLFILLGDQQLLVYGRYNERATTEDTYPFALWNRNTGTAIQFASPVFTPAFNTGDIMVGEPVFSPNGRYMMLDSLNFVYIWDLSNLSGSSPHLPNFTHAVESTRAAQFMDDATFSVLRETTTREQFASGSVELTTYIYDIVTGALVNTTVETLSYDYFTYIDLPR